MPSHYLNQCWNIVNWTLRNQLQWHFNKNSHIFIQENAFKIVVCEMAAILSQSQCINTKQWGFMMHNCLGFISSLAENVTGWGSLTNFLFINSLFFITNETMSYILHSYSTAMTPVKYKYHSVSLTDNLTTAKWSLTKKLMKGALVSYPHPRCPLKLCHRTSTDIHMVDPHVLSSTSFISFCKANGWICKQSN